MTGIRLDAKRQRAGRFPRNFIGSPWLNGFLLIAATALAVLVGEMAVRWLAPQDLSGTWRVELDDGLRVNRSHGHAKHQFGDRIIHYRFAPPHLRDQTNELAKFRVLVLGDSFTFGWLVASEDSFVGRWRELAEEEFGLGCLEFVNAGSGGWGTSDQLAYSERFIPELQPDVIVSVLNRYDVDRALRTRLYDFNDGKLVRRTFRETSSLKKLANGIPGYQWLLENSHLVQLLRKAGIAYASRTPKANAVQGDFESVPGDEQMQAWGQEIGRMYYRRLIEVAAVNSAKVIVVTTGWPAAADATAGFLQTAEVWFASMGIPFADLRTEVESALAGNVARFSIERDTHPNEAGHQVIAEATWTPLSRELRRVVEDRQTTSESCKTSLAAPPRAKASVHGRAGLQGGHFGFGY